MEQWAFAHGRFPEDYSVRSFLDTAALQVAFPERITLEQ